MTPPVPRARRATAHALRRPYVMLATVSFLGACGSSDPAPEEKVAAAVSASTTLVESGTFIELVGSAGLVSARVGHTAALSAPSATRVVRLLVTVGDRVAVGAPLVEFDLIPFDAAVSSAQAALVAAEQASARATRLVGAGIAPRRDAEIAATELASAQAAATTARRAREFAMLRAPIAGVVTRLSAVLGANVDAGQTLVELVDPSQVDVVLQFPPADAARLRVGQPVSFKENAGETAGPIGSGRVSDVSALVDSGTRAVSVRATVDTRDRPVRVGEAVFGEVTIGRRVGVTMLPDDALVPFDEGFRVFVVDTANIAHARTVSIGGRSGHRVWVRDGVKPGEKVVTAGAFGMDDGATVVTGGAKGQAKP